MRSRALFASLALLATAGLTATGYFGIWPTLRATVAASAEAEEQPRIARGMVCDDRNGNGVCDPGEPGLRGIRVSNRHDIVLTDARGRWELPYDDDTIFFVIKPAGYTTPFDDNNLPVFYYIHRPKGSPALRYGGVKPTGPLPESINFALRKVDEPERFTALFFGDTQSRNMREIRYLTDTVIAENIGSDAAFGVTLGDILFDDLSIFEEHNQAIALIGIPWYNVLGNHDINFDAVENEDSNDTFERYYGPAYYSFEYGKAHFVVLDNVWWTHGSKREDGRGRYHAAIGEDQLNWLRKNLDLVPKDRLVVLMMHIPLMSTEEKEDILGLLNERPYSLSVAAHTHFQEHHFLGHEHGHHRHEPHHHVVNVTTCGSWWQGSPDQYGIPHSTMRDGAPRGYSIFTFDGNQYSIEFRAAGKPASYQMNIYAPDEVVRGELAAHEVLVNVFGGSERSKVEMRLGKDGAWIPMEHVRVPDPEYVKMVERDRGLTAPYRPLPNPINSPHIWRASLPPSLETGMQPIHVRTTDMFGQTYLATRGILIRE